MTDRALVRVKDQRVVVYLPQSVLARLSVVAMQRGVTPAQLVEMLCRLYLER